MRRSRAIVAPTDSLLLAFLQRHLTDLKRTQVKQLLRHGAVFVNGNAVTRHDYRLLKGDRIVVEFHGGRPAPKVAKPDIVYDDRHIIVIEKPAGLLTIATDEERIRTAYRQVTAYVQAERPHRGERVFIVHRLDRETSGLLVFARNEAAKRALQGRWDGVSKKYYAVVEGVPRQSEGSIRSYLRESKSLKVHSVAPGPDAKPAVTHYRVIDRTRRFALLEVTPETGRKNQIRAHLSELGHPIVGDGKYGARTRLAKRIALHASYLGFRHPVSGKPMAFRSEMPREFKDIFKPLEDARKAAELIEENRSIRDDSASRPGKARGPRARRVFRR